jgi:ABC-type glycerol-3-phosphate transport system permease component
MNKSTGAKLFTFFNGLFLALLAVLCLLPVYHILVLSVSNKAAIAANSVSLWPIGFHLSAYKQLLSDSDFLRAFVVSIGRVTIGTALNMIVVVLSAYPLSLENEDFKGRMFLLWFLYLPGFFGGGLIPTYIQIGRAHV